MTNKTNYSTTNNTGSITEARVLEIGLEVLKEFRGKMETDKSSDLTETGTARNNTSGTNVGSDNLYQANDLDYAKKSVPAVGQTTSGCSQNVKDSAKSSRKTRKERILQRQRLRTVDEGFFIAGQTGTRFIANADEFDPRLREKWGGEKKYPISDADVEECRKEMRQLANAPDVDEKVDFRRAMLQRFARSAFGEKKPTGPAVSTLGEEEA
jgi:hypothetical protein